MDNSSLEKLLRVRFDIPSQEEIAVMSINKSFDSMGSYYVVEFLSFEAYDQKKLKRNSVKLRY
ncbi:hypothetical protein NVP1121O_129 [Vibrio phage 1.121.O._10N.286.46.C4]|nr:hypothetical protein NVP1121O_129 [Vibrio phage 1.121.O._10N.286.46.C4]